MSSVQVGRRDLRFGCLALSKLLLREFFELLDATCTSTEVSTFSSVFLNERDRGTSSSPSRRREGKGGARRPTSLFQLSAAARVFFF